VLALAVDRETVAHVRRAAGALDGLDVVEEDHVPDDVTALLRADAEPVEALLLGSTVEDPVQLAQRVCSVDARLPVLILSEPRRVPHLVRALQFAPLLGGYVHCHATTDVEGLTGELFDMVVGGRARQVHQRTLEALNAQLATASSTERRLGAEFTDRLLQHLPVGVVAVSDDGRVLAWNHAAQIIFGRSERDVLGSPLSVVFPEASRDRLCTLLARLGRPGAGSEQHVLERHRLDGREQFVEVIAAPLSGRTGERGGLLIVQDVTHRVCTEKERIDAERERARLVRDLRDAVRVRDEFLSTAAHELRTPLTSLKLSVQRLLVTSETCTGSAQVNAQLRIIDRNVGRLDRLIESLLDVQRMRGGPMEIERHEDVELGTVTREVLSRFAEEIRRAHSVVTVDAPEQVLGQWDRSRLDQIITNLVSNALKYGQGSPIEITLRREGDVGHFAIRDHGIGIPTTDQSRIFEPFERAVSPDHYGGLGLGLWIVRHIVEAHGGRISVESEPGEGSRFSVWLPLEHRSVR